MIKAAQTLHSKTDYSFQATVKKKKNEISVKQKETVYGKGL